MSTSLALARLELRRGWKSLVPIALLVAAVGAIVLWSFAAARRTETAFDRMLEATEAFDVLVNPDTGAETDLTTADLLTVDGVADASRVEAVGAFPPEADTVEEMFDTPGTIFATDGGSGYRLARPIIVDGRMPHADRADEIIADVEFAEIHDVDVGEALQLRFLTATNAAELLAVDEWAISEEPDEAEVEAAFAALIDRTDFAPVRELRVTGIGRWPDEVVVDDGFEQPAAMVTPALFDELGRPALFFGGWHVRLDDPSQISQFRRDVDAIVPDEFIVYQTMENVEAKAEKATSTPGGVMTIFAIVVLVLGTLLIGQSVQRWLDGRAVQLTLVRALGGSRSALGWSVTTQVGVAAVSGVVAGALVAVGASPLAPVGPARLVEVERGFQVDWFVLGFGMVGLGVLIIGASVIGWHATRRNASPNSPSRPSRSAWLRNVGMPLPVTTGVHFALDPVPGRRTSSRLAIVGVLTGVTLAVAALVFTASIERVASTPRLYGTNWSALVSFNGEFPDSTDVDEAYETAIQTIAEAPTVRGVSAVHAGELDVDGTRLPAIAFSDSSAPIGSTLAEGRLPVAPGEIALGRTTLRRLGVDIGDHVSLTTAAGPLDAEVVGRVVLPAIGTYSGADKTSLGEGALVDSSLLGPISENTFIAVDVEPGADLADLESRLAGRLPDLAPMVEAYGSPAEVTSLRALAAFPRWLSVALVGLVAIPVGHSLLMSVRARRRDLAIMSALGARPMTIRSIGFVQGVAVVIWGVVIGIPAGVLLGRLSWSGVAESFGTIPEPVVPVASLSVLALTVVVVGALVGGAPSWRTGRRAILLSLRPE